MAAQHLGKLVVYISLGSYLEWQGAGGWAVSRARLPLLLDIGRVRGDGGARTGAPGGSIDPRTLAHEIGHTCTSSTPCSTCPRPSRPQPISFEPLWTLGMEQEPGPAHLRRRLPVRARHPAGSRPRTLCGGERRALWRARHRRRAGDVRERDAADVSTPAGPHEPDELLRLSGRAALQHRTVSAHARGAGTREPESPAHRIWLLDTGTTRRHRDVGRGHRCHGARRHELAVVRHLGVGGRRPADSVGLAWRLRRVGRVHIGRAGKHRRGGTSVRRRDLPQIAARRRLESGVLVDEGRLGRVRRRSGPRLVGAWPARPVRRHRDRLPRLVEKSRRRLEWLDVDRQRVHGHTRRGLPPAESHRCGGLADKSQPQSQLVRRDPLERMAVAQRCGRRAAGARLVGAGSARFDRSRHRPRPLPQVDDFAGWTSQWEYMGGNFVGTPAIVASPGNRLDIVARAADDSVWHKAWNGASGCQASRSGVLWAGRSSIQPGFSPLPRLGGGAWTSSPARATAVCCTLASTRRGLSTRRDVLHAGPFPTNW